MAYIVYQDIDKFLNITLTANGQTLVNELINAVEAFAEDYCNRKWSVTGAQTEKFDGNTDTFFVKYPPINTVTSVKEDGSTLTANEDYYVYKTYVKFAVKAVDKLQTVEIVYTSAVALPNDLKHALVRWVSEIFKTQEDAGKTVSRISAGSISFDFLTQDGIPKYVQMVLNKYRLSPGF